MKTIEKLNSINYKHIEIFLKSTIDGNICRLKYFGVNFSMRNLYRTASDSDLEEKKSESKLRQWNSRETEKFKNKGSGISTSCGSRIFPRRGRQLPGGERQHTILPKFPENCMKSKEFGCALDPPMGVYQPFFSENLMKMKDIGQRLRGARP